MKGGKKYMNGSQGITPTIELASANNGNGFAYPVYPMMGGFGGNGGFGFGDGSAIWIILIIALLGGFGNNGGWGGFGGNSFDNGYAWLSNGQKEIMTNTNNGFDTLHLSNQLESNRDAISSLSNQLCNCCADMNQTVSNGFFNAEIAESNRQMANMNQLFGISTQLANASADNRLGVANLGSDIAREACATRTNDTQNTQTLLTAITGGIQSIKDQLCQDKIDSKNDEIAQLRQELLYSRGQASQVQQTADIRANNATVANQLVAELRSCPIPAMPVYGNQAIFTCPNSNGCGCGFNTTSQFI